ncbi:MAG: MarR family winged helix-turn-helix transcriptional regulator [Pseudobdellovibrio sp.]
MEMMNIYIDRLVSAHKTLMRHFAQENTLQMVQVEIIQYLSLCNRYSDTAQALSEYLGQTKGSLSQSINHLEDVGLIKRIQDKKDKRVYHIELTSKGLQISRKFQQKIEFQGETKEQIQQLKNLLSHYQRLNQLKTFGICFTCKYNIAIDQHKYKCGLTDENLSSTDVNLICREHSEQSIK